MPSVDIQSRSYKNNGDIGFHHSTGSSSPNLDIVRNLSKSGELQKQDILYGKDITQGKEIQQGKDKHQEFDIVRSLSKSGELQKQDILHGKDITQGKEIQQVKEIQQGKDKHQEIDILRNLSKSGELQKQDILRGKDIKQEKEIKQVRERFQEFRTWTRNIVTEWTRNIVTERWSTMSLPVISEQGHEQSQERGKSQQLSGWRVLHPLKALLVAGLLFTAGDIQGVEAAKRSKSLSGSKAYPVYDRGKYLGRGYIKTGWFGSKSVYSSSWFGRGKYLGRGSVKTGWFGRKYVTVRRRR